MKGTRILQIVMLSALMILSACAHHQPIPPEQTLTVYSAQDGGDALLQRFAPLFQTYAYQAVYNRIGSPSARYDGQGREQIFVDSQKPAVYFLKRQFSTKKDRYTNLIYRIHFPRVPFSLIPFNLSAGSNVGLIVVITIDSRQRPVLVTTVHTCGCYLAIIPTSYLPRDSLPLKFKAEPIRVYGEKLPWELDFSAAEHSKLLVHLRPEVHRVMDLGMIPAGELQTIQHFRVIKMPLKPAEELKRIPLGNKTTSFYHQKGPLKGHVKGSVKPLESILLSLPSLDFFVGADKVYGNRLETGNPFYTSLKPWNRSASDMWNFAEFLEFWGWRL
jgi:hypothetical protein